MADDTKSFTLLAVTKWSYVASRVLGSSGKPERDAPEAIRAMCHNCGATFDAVSSENGKPGTFTGLVGGMQIVCAKCGSDGTVPNP